MEKVIDENKQGSSLNLASKPENTKKLFIESYGCQMNFSDSEIVASILQKEGFNTTSELEDADLVYEITLPSTQWELALETCLNHYRDLEASDKAIDTYLLQKDIRKWLS